MKFSYWFTSPLLCLIASRFSFLLAGVCYWVITWEGWKIDCIWAVLLDCCREGDRHVYSFFFLYFHFILFPFSYKFFCSMKNWVWNNHMLSLLLALFHLIHHTKHWSIPLSYNIYAFMNNEDNLTLETRLDVNRAPYSFYTRCYARYFKSF